MRWSITINKCTSRVMFRSTERSLVEIFATLVVFISFLVVVLDCVSKNVVYTIDRKNRYMMP